jgi:hypothetical protein
LQAIRWNELLCQFLQDVLGKMFIYFVMPLFRYALERAAFYLWQDSCIGRDEAHVSQERTLCQIAS